jgi:hypothetical protein
MRIVPARLPTARRRKKFLQGEGAEGRQIVQPGLRTGLRGAHRPDREKTAFSFFAGYQVLFHSDSGMQFQVQILPKLVHITVSSGGHG